MGVKYTIDIFHEIFYQVILVEMTIWRGKRRHIIKVYHKRMKTCGLQNLEILYPNKHNYESCCATLLLVNKIFSLMEKFREF